MVHNDKNTPAEIISPHCVALECWQFGCKSPLCKICLFFLLLLYYGPTFYHPPWKTWKEGGGTFLVALVCFWVICFKSLCKFYSFCILLAPTLEKREHCTANRTLFLGIMVSCYQNYSDLLWEKDVLVIEKNVWNSMMKADNLQKVWDR